MKEQIIEKEERFYKECKISVFDTEESAKFGELSINRSGKLELSDFKGRNTYNDRFELYILSEEPINPNDWYEEFHQPHRILQNTTKTVLDNRFGSKIIASLTIPYDSTTSISKNWSGKQLPQPSDKFIQAYIEAYNKGEKIEKVLVEFKMGNFRPDGSQGYFEPGAFTFEWQPKLKDNNIIIKKIKDSWNIAEIEEIHIAIMKQGCLYEGGSWSDEHERLVRFQFQKWKQYVRNS